MTIDATPIPTITALYTGPGSYSFGFLAYEEDTIVVYYTSDAGIVTTLVQDVDYTLTIDPAVLGGTVVTSAPADTDGRITIRRVEPLEQPVDWVNNNAFDMEILEKAQDRLVMMIQQINTLVNEGLVTTEWKGDWATTTDYAIKDMVLADNHNIYICNVAHTSGTFTTDLAAGYWSIVLDVEYLEQLQNAMAQEWAENPEGDEITDNPGSYSALHWAAKSEELAEKWAETPEGDEVPDNPGHYSALHWSAKAEDWADTVHSTETLVYGPLWEGNDRATSKNSLFDKFESVQEAIDEIPGKNLFINGGFQHWQRGSSSSGTGYQSADRWYAYADMSTLRTTPIDGSNNFIYLKANTAIETNLGIVQGIELDDWSSAADQLKGKTFTISFDLYTVNSWHGFTQVQYVDEVGSSINAVNASSIDNTLSNVAGEWTRIIKTFTISADRASTSRALAVSIGLYKFGGIPINTTFYIRNAKLEEGSVATPFVLPGIGEELAKCQRYYEVGGYSSMAPEGSQDTYDRAATIAFKAQKKATPTIVVDWASSASTGGATITDKTVWSFKANTTPLVGQYDGVAEIDGWTADAEL